MKKGNFLTTVLIFMVIAFCVLSLAFMIKDRIRPCGDEARKLLIALKFYIGFSQGGNIFSILNIENYHSPLYFLLPSFLCFLFKSFSYQICVSVNLLYYILIAIFTYFLTKKITGDKKAAILAVLFLSSMHYYFLDSAHLFIMEFGLCAFVTLSMFLLIKTNYFISRIYSVLFGISIGLGMLMKWTFIIYLSAPTLLCIAYASKYLATSRKELRKQIYKNMVIAIMLGGSIFLVYSIFFLKPDVLLRAYRDTLFYESEVKNIVDYIFIFLNYLIYFTGLVDFNRWNPCFAKLIFTGIAIFSFYEYIKREKKEYKFIFLLWLFMPLLLISFIAGYVDFMYILPVLPAEAVIIAAGLNNIIRKRAKIILVTSAVALVFNVFIFNNLYIYSLMETGNPIEKVLFKINVDATKQKRKIVFAINADNESIADLVKYYIVLHNLNIDFVDIRNYVWKDKQIKEFDVAIAKKIKELDYLLSDYPAINDILLISRRYIKKQMDAYYNFRYNDNLIKIWINKWDKITLYRAGSK